MNNPIPTTCEQILPLINRHLDGDLNKEDTWKVYYHIQHCESCQAEMIALAELEVDLTQLNEIYETYVLDEQFNEKIQVAIVREERKTILISQWDRLKNTFKFFKPVTNSRLFPISLGAAGSFLFLLVLLPQFSPQQAPVPTRFTVNEIQFNKPEDKVDWNTNQTIAPGESAVFAVSEADKKSFYFRMLASKPVPVVVEHPQDNQNIPLEVNGVRYATLKTPQTNDAIVIRNDGSTPLQVQTHTPRPRAMNIRMNAAANR